MIDIEPYVNLFEKLAQSHPKIAHGNNRKAFVRMHYDEMGKERSDDLSTPLLALADGEEYLASSTITPDDRELFHGCFMVLDRWEDKGDFDEYHAKLASTKLTTNDIIQWLRSNHDDDNCLSAGDKEILCCLIASSIRMEAVQNKQDTTFLGWKVFFTLADALAPVDPTRWNFNTAS